MLPWIVDAYVFAFAACCCSEDASATCLVGDGSRPWLPLVGRSPRLDLGILELAHLRGNYGSSTRLITCTMPFDAEMSVATIPAAESCSRVSFAPFSIT